LKNKFNRATGCRPKIENIPVIPIEIAPGKGMVVFSLAWATLKIFDYSLIVCMNHDIIQFPYYN
jgi:hypothetical protein